MNDEASFLNELKRHCRQMAPHQKDRHAGRLLIRSITAVEELVELKTRLIQRTEESATTAYRDAETIRAMRAVIGQAADALLVCRLNIRQPMAHGEVISQYIIPAQEACQTALAPWKGETP